MAQRKWAGVKFRVSLSDIRGKAVMMTQDYLKSIINYDPDTGDFSWSKPTHRKCWNLIDAGGAYHKEIVIDGTPYLAHKLAWLYVYGRYPAYCRLIDEDGINTKILNISDIRPKPNKKKKHYGAKMPVGTSWHNGSNRWAIVTAVPGENRTKYIGSTKSLFEAAAMAISERNKRNKTIACRDYSI